MTDEKKPSQLRLALDQEVIPAHRKWLHEYPSNVAADLEFQRPVRSPPQYTMPKPPMAAMARGASIKVDGRRVGDAPHSWSEQTSTVNSIPTPPATPEQQREQRRQRKARELEALHARSEARRLRDEEEAERAGPPQPTMSAAAQAYFMKGLMKRERS